MAGVKEKGAEKPREPAPQHPEKTVTRPPNKMVGPGGSRGGYQTK